VFAEVKSHPELALLKWLALLVLAGALALLLVGTALGAKDVRPPGLLPPDIPAEPMPERSSDLPDMEMPRDPFGLAAELWKAIELQQSGNIDAAIETWEAVRLPRETEHWRLLMLGVAYLQRNDIDHAVAALEQSEEMMPDNPVVYYAFGLAAMQQAATADEWYDALNVDPFRLAAYPPTDVPLTRCHYRLIATMAFERAVELAPYVDLDETLLPAAWVIPEGRELSVALMVPRARDALKVFGGDRFEAKSHKALGWLHLERGALAHCENHFDRAADLGEATGDAFRELAEQYEEAGHPQDAMRANLKAFSHGGGAAALEDAWRSFGKALIGN
jgi:tetratricopeptide (TPR) repeat protein